MQTDKLIYTIMNSFKALIYKRTHYSGHYSIDMYVVAEFFDTEKEEIKAIMRKHIEEYLSDC